MAADGWFASVNRQLKFQIGISEQVKTLMSELDTKNTDGEEKQEGSARRPVVEQPVPHAPGGPGWASEHSGILWIIGTVVAISALVIYMIIDNN